MKKILLTESEKQKIISDKEKLIIETFAKNFNKIKRIDEEIFPTADSIREISDEERFNDDVNNADELAHLRRSGEEEMSYLFDVPQGYQPTHVPEIGKTYQIPSGGQAIVHNVDNKGNILVTYKPDAIEYAKMGMKARPFKITWGPKQFDIIMQG